MPQDIHGDLDLLVPQLFARARGVITRKDTGPVEDTLDRSAHDGAFAEPVEGLGLIHRYMNRILNRVIGPEDLDEATVTRGTGVRNHDTIERSFLSSMPCQTNLYRHRFFLLRTESRPALASIQQFS